MRMVAFVAVVAVAAGVLGCSRPQMVGAAVGVPVAAPAAPQRPLLQDRRRQRRRQSLLCRRLGRANFRPQLAALLWFRTRLTRGRRK